MLFSRCCCAAPLQLLAPLLTRFPTPPPPAPPAALVSNTTSLTLAWGDGGPEGLGQADYWAARFTFYLEVPADGSYMFQLNADDDARLLVDGVLVTVANQRLAASTSMSAGYHKLEVLYVDITGPASMSLLWIEGQATVSRARWPAVARGCWH